MVTAEQAEAAALEAHNFRTYKPLVEKYAVVVGELGFAKKTAPGPESWVQVTASVRGGVLGSVTVPWSWPVDGLSGDGTMPTGAKTMSFNPPNPVPIRLLVNPEPFHLKSYTFPDEYIPSYV
jgi:hypothetical protein